VPLGEIVIKLVMSVSLKPERILLDHQFTMIQVKFFWVVVGYQCFGGPCCLLQGEVRGVWIDSSRGLPGYDMV